MIEFDEIFFESDKRIALWCESVTDTAEMVAMASGIVESGTDLISVPIESVSGLWTHLEKYKIKIFARYYFNPIGKDIDSDMDNLARNITSVLKKGGDGVQIFVKMRDFYRFLEMFAIVRDDLFFQKDLCIAMDVQDIDIDNIDSFLNEIKNIRTNSLLLTLNEDDGMQSDFVGRVYALLQKWDLDTDLHFALGNNFDRIDQAIRLIECIRPDNKTRFFLDF